MKDPAGTDASDRGAGIPSRSAAPDEARGPGAILIVESNPMMRDYLAHLLRSRFPLVAVAAVDGEREALLGMLAGAPELIFVHVVPGDSRGFEMIRRFRRAAPAARVVFLSDCDWPGYREEALRCGVDHYLERHAVRIEDILGAVGSAGGAVSET